MESELALARPELDLDRAQRQAERQHVAAHGLEDGLDLIEAGLGEERVALRDEAHLDWCGRPGRVRWRKARIVELEDMQFDLQARLEFEARRAESRQHLAAQMTRRERHRGAVREIKIAQ